MKRPVVALLSLVIPGLCLAGGLIGSFLVCFSIPVFWQIGLRGQGFSSLGFQRDTLRPSIAWGMFSGILLGVLGGSILSLFKMTGYSVSNPRAVELALGPFNHTFQLRDEIGAQVLLMSSTPAGLIFYLLFMIGVIGLGEELFWRGFIQQKLKLVFSKPVAVTLCALLFCAVHCYLFVILPLREGLYFLILIFIAGLSWGYLFERTRAVWAPAISHGITAFIIWKYFFFR